MGYKEIDIRFPGNSSDKDLEHYIRKSAGLKVFRYNIILKSLDARNKRKITWQYRIGIVSDELNTGEKPLFKTIDFPVKKFNQKVLVAGSGPAGIFASLVLASAGMQVTLLEKGSPVELRKKSIDNFESTGIFDENNNYAFGEGGAGTFSDGKLTSRTKSISLERNYIFKTFVDAGAPEEIMYMTHPHIGSDNLFKVTHNLRKKFEDSGGHILFNTTLDDINIKGNKVARVSTSAGTIEADYLIIAPGHSNYETYRMLIRHGVPFSAKNFAIGMRAEHAQCIINKAQWGVEKLPGIKAAEYRLTASETTKLPVYTFCMCPGGVVVPSTPYKHTNIVNGMSLFSRSNTFANAAVVAGVNAYELPGGNANALQVLEWLENLENGFYTYSNSYKAPSVTIHDFLKNKTSQRLPDSSYPLGLVPADLASLLPKNIIDNLKDGLRNFSRKLNGYDQGLLIGLESKTSSPIQVVRDKNNYSSGFDNLFLAGEGSGWAGGIVSSAADGIKVALSILNKAK